MARSGPKIYSQQYYDTLLAIEQRHWWTLGMRDLMDKLLSERLLDRPNLRVLDSGCGSGAGLAWARSRLQPARLIGMDISALALEHCVGRTALQTELLLGSATALPLADASQDLVICNDLLQHVEDDQRVVDEARRVLAPGGLFFARTNGRFVLPLQPGCLRLYRRRRLRQLLHSAGLRPLLVAPVNVLGSLLALPKYYLGVLGRRMPDRHHATDATGGDHDDPGGGLQISASQSAKPSVTERLLRRTLALEGSLLKRLPNATPFGHSHLLLAEKPAD